MIERSSKQIAPVQVARYRFHWRIKTPLQLPPYASSTLRGVFGRMLRQLACLTRANACRGCAMASACPYPQLFEPQTVPRPQGGQPALAPYAIETPFTFSRQEPGKDLLLQPGKGYTFDMVLMTPAALDQLSLIVAAWRHAFAKGVGKGNGTAELVQVEHLPPQGPSSNILSAANASLQSHNTALSVPRFYRPEDVMLRLQTPLRIEQRGTLINERSITPAVFLRHLIRRVSFQVCAQQPSAFPLDEIHQLNALADRVKEGERKMLWCDWERYSSRQSKKMKLGGLVGCWELLQVPPQLLPLIYLGQWLHLGKGSAFGLGKYRWQIPSLDSPL